nr:LAN rich 32kDa silk protein [Plectrocnemia conspersa]
MKLYIAVLLFLFYKANSECTISLVPYGKSVACKQQICPAHLPPGDLNDPVVMRNSQRAIAANLWNQPFPATSQYSNDVRTLLLQMSISNNDAQENYAFLATMWIWATVPQISQNPSLCAQADLINAAVNWGNPGNNDCTEMISVVQNMAGSVINFNKFVTASAIQSSGCALFKLHGSMGTCTGNGLTYNVAGIYNRYGSTYPPQLQTLNNVLYTSPVYIDKVMGNLLAVSLVPQGQQLLGNFGNSLKAMTFTMATSPKLTRCCCKKFMKELCRVRRLTVIDAKQAAIKTLEDMGCSVPCDTPPKASHSCELHHW